MHPLGQTAFAENVLLLKHMPVTVKLREEPPRRQLHGPAPFVADDIAEAV